MWKHRKTMEKKPPYKPLNIKERDMLYAIYEKHNGNMSSMVLDKDCIFKGFGGTYVEDKKDG